MADEETVDEAQPEQSGGKKKMLLFGAGGFLLLVIGIFAGPAVMNMISPPEVEDDDVAEAPAPIGPAIYQSMHPPLLINFKDAYGDAHFMQVTLEVMARNQDVVNSVRDHTPAIRNALILTLSQAVYEKVITREGKEAMLSEALVTIQDVMTDRIGEPGIEEVYFTALVIQ